MVSYVGFGSHTTLSKHSFACACKVERRRPTKPYYTYFPICDAACELQEQLVGCYDHYGLSNASRHATCGAANASSDNRWGWNYVECLENHSWRQRESAVDHVAVVLAGDQSLPECLCNPNSSSPGYPQPHDRHQAKTR